MKKLFVLLVIAILGYYGYQYLDDNLESKSNVSVADCQDCEYMINDHRVKIKDNIVYIDDNSFGGIKQITVKSGIIFLINDTSVIGYNKKKLFSYSNGFDTSYPGMKIETIKPQNDKLIIKTTRILDKFTIDIGTKFPICASGTLNYSGLKDSGIDVTEPVTLTYDVNYNDYKAVISYKYTLGDYYKDVGSC